MALAARRDAPMGVAEYRVWVEARPDAERWELLDGQPVLMAPASERHNLITFNLARGLAALAQAIGCRVTQGTAVVNDFADDYAPVPDLVLRCGPLLDDGYARDPILVAEVLSPSTIVNDRGRKFEFYKGLQTLRMILLVYQNEARVEVWRRRDAAWDWEVSGPDGLIDLPDLGGRIPISAVYDGVPLN